MRLKKTLITAAVVASTVLAGIATASAHDGGGGGAERDTVSGEQQVLDALQRDLGLSAEEARQLAARQADAIKLDVKLKKKLGGAFAGSVLDAETGKLTVMVSRKGALATVRAEGAEAKLVDHSRAKLNRVKAQLDGAAGRAKGDSAAVRKQHGKAAASVAALGSWYVDPVSNTVRVTADKGQLAKAKKAVAKYGDAVTVVRGRASASPTDRFFDGGDGYNGNNCSVGINVRNPSTGQGYMITAGHCVSAGSTLWGHDWVKFGPVLQSFFPSYDDAIARNDSAGYWLQGAWVDTNPTHGGIISYSGYTDAPVGTVICKSGITTKYTCGSITGKNETVTYTGGQTVYGLTRHSACVEPGDSGGANVSAFYNWYSGTWSYKAEGVTSGAQLYWKDGVRRCGAAVGASNVSWYFPIADSLAYYGPKYGIQVWN